MARVLGVSARTYAYYEQGERVPDGEALAQLVAEGWNVNWLLTGEGPERLSQFQVADARGRYESHALRMEALTLAVELIDSELERAGKTLPPEKRAAAYGLVYDELIEPGELPNAKIVQLVIKAVA